MQLSRRSVLQATALGAVGWAASACGGDSGDSVEYKDFALPTYVPWSEVKPDLPGTAAGIAPAYLRYPANPPTTIPEPPAKGGTISAFVPLYQPVPPGMGKNAFWKELNERVGATMDFNMAPGGDMGDKFQTLIAGGDIPDLAVIPDGTPRKPALLNAEFQDLSEFLAGDAVKDYPFLANLPTYAWQACLLNGHIYGIPMHRSITGLAMYVRTDLTDELGVTVDVKRFSDYFDLCKEVSAPRNSRWALADPNAIQLFIQQMLHIPNDWIEKGGKFTAAIETDEYKQAIESVRQMVQAEVFHPDWISGSLSVEDLFYAGTTVLLYGGFSDWGDYVPKLRAVSPQGRFEPILPPGFDGGKGSHFPGGPSYNMTALRKADKGRIEELLAVANWFAAPLGTSEYLFRKFGVPDVDYTLDGTDPVLTPRGERETTVPTLYITDSPFTIYWPKEPDVVRAWYDYQKRSVPIVMKNPTVGLYSETDGTAGERLGDLLQTVRQDIYQGKEPVSAWDDAVAKWRKDGGDKIRKEYEESFKRASQ